MYLPKHFKIEDKDRMFDLIEENSFATLISQHNGEPYATHLPLVLNREKGFLTGHFARPNGQWQDVENQTVLAIFHGPHTYISPSWYETAQAVPTWNYVAVHIYGKMELMEDDQELFDALAEMVHKYERPGSSYQLENVDITGMSKGIVGFNIKIERIEGKAKLSQNHPVERRELVIKQLEAAGEIKISGLMKESINLPNPR